VGAWRDIRASYTSGAYETLERAMIDAIADLESWDAAAWEAVRAELRAARPWRPGT
jgi:hypothetical protein